MEMVALVECSPIWMRPYLRAIGSKLPADKRTQHLRNLLSAMPIASGHSYELFELVLSYFYRSQSDSANPKITLNVCKVTRGALCEQSSPPLTFTDPQGHAEQYRTTHIGVQCNLEGWRQKMAALQKAIWLLRIQVRATFMESGGNEESIRRLLMWRR